MCDPGALTCTRPGMKGPGPPGLPAAAWDSETGAGGAGAVSPDLCGNPQCPLLHPPPSDPRLEKPPENLAPRLGSRPLRPRPWALTDLELGVFYETARVQLKEG